MLSNIKHARLHLQQKVLRNPARVEAYIRPICFIYAQNDKDTAAKVASLTTPCVVPR